MHRFPAVPRSLFYPQSELDHNPNAPTQKVDPSEKYFGTDSIILY